MRDLVRRAILARLCLGAQPDPVWPFTGDLGVDAILADDTERSPWRARWHKRLEAIGFADAAGPLSAAVDALTQEDR